MTEQLTFTSIAHILQIHFFEGPKLISVKLLNCPEFFTSYSYPRAVTCCCLTIRQARLSILASGQDTA